MVRTLIAVDLYEISPCSFPAYQSSEVSIRSLASCPVEIRAKMKQRDAEQCSCDCAECAGGDCGLCSDADCDEEYCSCAESRSIRNADANRVMNIRLAFTD